MNEFRSDRRNGAATMNRFLMRLRLVLGGAICGSFLGFFVGALAGTVYGTWSGDLCHGLQGAFAGGAISFGLGAIYGFCVGSGKPSSTTLARWT